jgi:hypothetical protein
LYEVIIPGLNDKTLGTTTYENMNDSDPAYSQWLSMPPSMLIQ